MLIETPAEIQAEIFKVLSRTLTIEGFTKLEPEIQRATLDEASALLKSAIVKPTNKRQLVAYLEALQSCPGMDAVIVGECDRILNHWNDPPF